MIGRLRQRLLGMLPLVLTLGVVLGGFSLMFIRQHSYDAYQQHMDVQIRNATAKKELGELIVVDLQKLATRFHMILVASNHQEQQSVQGVALQDLKEIRTVLDVLEGGGTLSRTLSLNLPGLDSLSLPISYRPDNLQEYNLDVLVLRPQLVALEGYIAQTIEMTSERNRLLNFPEGEALRQAGRQLRAYAKEVHSHFERMEEGANRLVYDANRKLILFRNNDIEAKKEYQQTELFWIVATLLGVFVGICLIYRQILNAQNRLQRNIAQLQQTEFQLQESHVEILALNRTLEEQVVTRTAELHLAENQWSNAFDAVKSPIFLHDQEGRLLKANQAYLNLAGLPLEEASGRQYWTLFPRQESPLPGCLESLADYRPEACSEELDVGVGDRIYRSRSFVVRGAQEQFLYAMHLMEDVTERRRVSVALAESEKRFREVTDSLNDVLILLDTDLNVQLLNPAAVRTYGIQTDDYVGKPCYQVFWNRDEACDQCPVLEVIRTGRVVQARHTLDNGRIINRMTYPVYDFAGKVVACTVIASDVTEREQYIEKLQRFEQILSTETDLVAFIDCNHTYLAANRVYSEYFDVKPEEIVGRPVKSVIGYQRYEATAKRRFELCLQGLPQDFQAWVEFPLVGRRHMDISFTPYAGEDQKITGLVSRARDITEKTEQEARLRLSAKVFESTTEGIIITDRDATILAVNPAFCQITGYLETEVLGEKPRLLTSGRHDQDFYRQLWRQLLETGQWRGEIWNRRKNNEIYPELLTISSIKDEQGETSNYVAIFTDMTSIKEAVALLEHQAHHHPLTGLPNRLLLYARLEHSIQYAKRERKRGAVLFLDLDNFKKINDSLGHSAGDEVIKEVAQRLLAQVREVDTVAHLSGDEFVLVLQQIRSRLDATTLAQQILAGLQRVFKVGDYELYVSGSIGIIEFSGDCEDIEGLLKNADIAMNKAKEAGKNCFHLYSPDLTNAAIERVLLESHLHRAMERNELVLYYQPQVALPGGRMVAAEALVRWQHPDIGLIPPDKFIPLSEETGLIISMGEWILRTACEQMVTWRAQGYPLRRIAVNLSGRQIQLQNLPQTVERILRDTGLSPDALELEITEGFIMQHPEQSISVLQRIRALGVELSIDDFGTGHSSLSYLKKLPIHRLKIDRSFVWDIGENRDGEAITRTVIAMGHSLGLQITAEGVETPEQRSFLEGLGCNEAQGFVFSKPLPADQIESLLRTQHPQQDSSSPR